MADTFYQWITTPPNFQDALDSTSFENCNVYFLNSIHPIYDVYLALDAAGSFSIFMRNPIWLHYLSFDLMTVSIMINAGKTPAPGTMATTEPSNPPGSRSLSPVCLCGLGRSKKYWRCHLALKPLLAFPTVFAVIVYGKPKPVRIS